MGGGGKRRRGFRGKRHICAPGGLVWLLNMRSEGKKKGQGKRTDGWRAGREKERGERKGKRVKGSMCITQWVGE